MPKLKLFTFAGLIALAAMIIAVPVHAGPLTNLVLNGSFEQTTLTGGGGFFCAAGSTCTSNVSNWSSSCLHSSCATGSTPTSLLSGTSGSAFNGGIGLYGPLSATPDGGFYVAADADPTYASPIWQTINGLTPGLSYTLTFYQAGAQQSGAQGANTEQWKVNFGATSTQTSQLINNVQGGSTPWTLQTMYFTADATSEVLQFLAVGTPKGGPPVALLDGVSLVQSTPEPQAFALVGLGLVAVPFVSRLRRSRRSQSK